MTQALPTGSLSAAPCPGMTLHVLIGDSIDREVVRSRCDNPVVYDPKHCAKCALCNSQRCGESAWLNVMTFGLGVYGCVHIDKWWAPNEESRDVKARIRSLLGPVLSSTAAATYERIVVSLHSGAWDVLATKECSNISQVVLHSPSAWFEAAEDKVLTAVEEVVSSTPLLAARVQRPLLWRTVPLICRSFAGGEDASELFAAVSAW